MTAGLSSELIAFIARHIQSIRQLEVLLWLQAYPEKSWTAGEIARSLRCNEWATTRWLEEFEAARLLVTDGSTPLTYRFAPQEETKALVARLATEYKIRQLRVIDAIVNQPTKRMFDLMDAFRFKSGEEEDDS